MDAMGGRPVLMERYPDGVPGKSFFQKRVPASRPDWLRTTVVSTPNGTTSEALVIGDVAHVLWAVNLGCLGFHVWPSRASDPAHADELRFDLDPMPKVTFDEVRTAAGTRADATGGDRHPQLGQDLWQQGTARLRTAAPVLELHAGALWRRWPPHANSPAVIPICSPTPGGKRARSPGVHRLQPERPHKTVFGAWSVRPRVGAQVSTPIPWEEVRVGRPAIADRSDGSAAAGRRGRPVGRSLGEPAVTRTPALHGTNATWKAASWTPHGHPSTPRCPTNHRGSPPAGRNPRAVCPGGSVRFSR